jgi:hypothetical protein
MLAPVINTALGRRPESGMSQPLILISGTGGAEIRINTSQPVFTPLKNK